MSSPLIFDWVCKELERITSLDRLESRGTVRICLKAAGIDAERVTAHEMAVVLEKLLPGELELRDVSDAAGICAQLASEMQQSNLDGGEQDPDSPEDVFGRLGKS